MNKMTKAKARKIVNFWNGFLSLESIKLYEDYIKVTLDWIAKGNHWNGNFMVTSNQALRLEWAAKKHFGFKI